MRPTLGVCYYPEQWPETAWPEDARRMAEAGISHVRIGEFAWSRLEPKRGELRFDWLLRAMDTLAAHGLRVIVGTPTATPPKWLVDERPDMLPVDANGHQRHFGSRRHYDFSHYGYRQECRRIVTALAAAVGDHPALAGWQVDNEFGCHDTTLSYSTAALTAFRQWLHRRYGEIEHLNTAWGNAFWSMDYGSFDQVELPGATVTEANPAHCMDFRRFASDQVASFGRLQVEILKRARPDLPVMHNFMGRFADFDHFDVGAGFDVAGWDSYPLGFLDKAGRPDEFPLFSRQGDPDFQAFHHDLYRAVGRGRFWLAEQQPGPVNWAPYNADPLPGMVRLWTWEAIAHGAELVSYFRWRQAPFAQEQMHAGLLRPDSQPAPALEEVRQLAAELDAIDLGQPDARARVAIVFDYQSDWAWRIQPQAAGFSYFELMLEFYSALRKHGLDIDIVPSTETGLSRYDLVIVPALFTWSLELRQALSGFGGTLLVGPRSGSKTPYFSIPSGLPPDLETELPGLKVVRVETLRPPMEIAAKGGGNVRLWREKLDLGTAETLISDEEGCPVLVRQARCHYLAALGDRALIQRVTDLLLDAAGIDTVPLPFGVRCRRRGPYRVYVNYGAGAANLVQRGDEAGYILGGPDMPPAGVSVVRLATDGTDR